MKKYRVLIAVLFFLCAVSIVVMIICLNKTPTYKATFVPPKFDVLAKKGIPSVEQAEEYGLGTIEKDGIPYKTAICGKVIVRNQKAFIFFTNYEENTVWLKLRVLNVEGNTIAETGLIKPGEYLETVALFKPMENGEKVKLKIMAYEPDTYYSAGSITLNTIVQTGE